MMFNVWGDDYVGINDVKKGFSVVDEFKELGFHDGDKILTINGKEPFNVLDVNKHLFLRDISTIEVEHTDGENEKIELPEEIGLTMWQSGNMEPFTPRIYAVLDSILPESPADKGGLLKGDHIVNVNGCSSLSCTQTMI